MDDKWKYPRAVEVKAGEIQIDAQLAMPVVGDRAFPNTAWYRVDANTGKVTIRYHDEGQNEKTEEFDIKNVVLSGWPPEERTNTQAQGGSR